MLVNFHGMLCQYGTYRLMDENKPILTLIDPNDWLQSLQYEFTEPQYGLWCHFLTDKELEQINPCLSDSANSSLNHNYRRDNE